MVIDDELQSFYKISEEKGTLDEKANQLYFVLNSLRFVTRESVSFIFRK